MRLRTLTFTSAILAMSTSQSLATDEYRAAGLCGSYSGVVDQIFQSSEQGMPYEAAVTMISGSADTDIGLYDVLVEVVSGIYDKNEAIVGMMQNGRFDSVCVKLLTEDQSEG